MGVIQLAAINSRSGMSDDGKCVWKMEGDYMDNNERARLQRVATDALVGHWPLHLGLTTEGAQIEYLAKSLDNALSASVGYDKLLDDVSALQEDLADRESTIEELKDGIRELATTARLSL